MARRDWDEDRNRAFRSGYDEGSDFEPRLRSGFDRDPNFDRTLRAPFREYGRAGGRPSRPDFERESSSRMHFEEDRSGYGEAPLYEFGRYGGYGPRSDREFGGGGFQRFGDPYGFESGYARTPEASYPAGYGREGFGPAGSYAGEGDDRRPAFGWGEGRQQSKRGLGPKGYVRSDERIREDICDRLTDDPSLDASEIEVKVANCEVTLSGTVDSRDEKRSAEDWAESIAGVQNVQNNLRIEEKANAPGMATEVGGNATAQPAEARQRETT